MTKFILIGSIPFLFFMFVIKFLKIFFIFFFKVIQFYFACGFNIARNKHVYMQSIRQDGDFAFLPKYATDDDISINTNQVKKIIYKF